MAFKFLDPGPLIDGDLTLIPPSHEWVDEALRSANHPLSIAAHARSAIDRARLLQFLTLAPDGRQPPDPRKGWVPAYHFWMLTSNPNSPIRIVGGIGLRIGETRELELYFGHVGYHVYGPANGRHYAERATRLVLPLAKRHGINPLWITCNPDNVASRRTCERLGAMLVDVVEIPPKHEFYERGERSKCRYQVRLD